MLQSTVSLTGRSGEQKQDQENRNLISQKFLRLLCLLIYWDFCWKIYFCLFYDGFFSVCLLNIKLEICESWKKPWFRTTHNIVLIFIEFMFDLSKSFFLDYNILLLCWKASDLKWYLNFIIIRKLYFNKICPWLFSSVILPHSSFVCHYFVSDRNLSLPQLLT